MAEEGFPAAKTCWAVPLWPTLDTTLSSFHIKLVDCMDVASAFGYLLLLRASSMAWKLFKANIMFGQELQMQLHADGHGLFQ
jgi:hypothetical protein